MGVEGEQEAGAVLLGGDEVGTEDGYLGSEDGLVSSAERAVVRIGITPDAATASLVEARE